MVEGSKVVFNVDEFAEQSDIIIANRISDELNPWADKVYTRDIFANN
jgi:UDPglucose 6-dehydrogenase